MKTYDAIIIGSGAAAYNAADCLYKNNVRDIVILSENRLHGTSRNTGSDKQTYYKISMDGKGNDSPYRMAADMASGGSADGVKAYKHAVNSMRCFLKLYDYGVKFPRDEFGGFPGYKTDHDDTTRATSVGPLTSKLMTEKLEEVVLVNNKTPLIDNRLVVEILTDNGRVCGVTALDTVNEKIENYYAKNVIAATGAPACIYKHSVFPLSQHGMTGVMIDSGVRLCNYSQWQYGMASVDFRWNVSGSFMQVVPRFVSVDKDGNEREFLSDYFDDIHTAYSFVFLKGYQWPFSADRTEMSSAIDIAVHSEISKGRKVYLDYRKNPRDFCFDKLCDEAKEYLTKTESMAQTPVERLFRLNSKAIDVYMNQGIDLYNDMLRIAVCAQHNNGGVYTDDYFMSDIRGLYVVGEAGGSFGLSRPGGSALNDTQVSSLVAAEHVAGNIKDIPDVTFVRSEYENITDEFITDDSVDYSYIPEKMSDCCSFIRDEEKCRELLIEIEKLLENYPPKHRNIEKYFLDRDMLISARALLITVLAEMKKTGSRGGAIFVSEGKRVTEDVSYRDYLTVTDGNNVYFEKTKAVPVTDRPFEYYLKG